eukprot:TRINITY_DN44436_c0_g1_i1.p1 TRINITY_DN44436_c0_g1~~TRINITY_DN44436_c0_g1_i1.p1  ORF type:complete len:1179 (+),score=393.39 TRINITY_DN44436_c0_g1_i1:363-3539(+)
MALPLAFILAVSSIKAGYEDYLRHKEDNKLNNKIHTRVGEGGRIEQVRSKNIRVGDILRVAKNEFFPADCILIASSSTDNNCYINTAELDGETAPKARRSPRLGLPDNSAETISKIKGSVIGSPPYAKFDGFEGRIDLVNEAGEHHIFGLADEQICLRGSKVDNSQFVYCLVYATGKDTKLMLNRLASNFKFSSFEKALNRGVLFSFLLEVAINLVFCFANSSETTFDELERSYWTNVAYEFVTSFILFSYLIPLSLYVSMELTKFGQGFIIANDTEMSVVEWEVKKPDDDEIKLDDELEAPGGIPPAPSDIEQPAPLLSQPSFQFLPEDQVPIRKLPRVKTTDINDELGMIEFIMTDKTGTLTKNKMELKACFVDGFQFINADLFPQLVAAEKAKLAGKFDNVETLENLVNVVWKESLAQELNKRLPEHTISQDPNHSIMKDFILNILCCNDVIASRNRSDPNKGKYIFQSLSPDEIAFNEALQSNGICLTSSSDVAKDISVELEKDDGSVEIKRVRYKIHGLLGFTADRKRMSVVVENPEGRFKLFTKGADSKLATFLENTSINEKMMTMANDYLKKFANDGNRTLAFASRTLSPGEFEEWKSAFTEAQVALEGREKKIEAAFALIENRMTLNGCTSVEDPLQDGVPPAIDSLVHAGIIVVVLTGDKQETAVAIGKASKIVQSDATLHYIHSEEFKQLESELQSLLATVQEHSDVHHALVIGGNSLEISISQLTSLFLDVLTKMQTVVCSRATPSQKAAMVNLVKTELKKVCLAIGDGANDVSMIQKANVGVGLTGKEGTQAAQSADFVLHRFRHLPRLLFVHGRYSYIRMCKTVYWSFYKNTLFPFPLVFYGIFSSWSSMPFFDSYLMNLFNVCYTSLPPLVIGWTEKDELEKVHMENPNTYSYFRDNEKFTVWRFIQYLFFGILQSCVIFWVGYGVFYDSEVISNEGRASGMYVFGQWQIIAIIVVINVTFLMWTSNWTRAMVGSVALGIVVLLLSLVIFSWWISVDADMYGLTNYIFPIPMQYLYLFVTCGLCLTPAYLQVAYESRPKQYKQH